MARRNTFQYTETTSVNREKFLDVVVRNENLSKKDLRVCLHLLTHLDSMVFKEISKKQIADDLNISKKDISSSIENLILNGIIESGSSATVSKGYKLENSRK